MRTVARNPSMRKGPYIEFAVRAMTLKGIYFIVRAEAPPIDLPFVHMHVSQTMELNKSGTNLRILMRAIGRTWREHPSIYTVTERIHDTRRFNTEPGPAKTRRAPSWLCRDARSMVK